MDAPLAGVKVIDFTRHMAGPYATVMMADYGADVVKVESLPIGDPSRTTGIHFTEGESALFLAWNRGKRSVALDMRDSRGRAAVRRLIAQADVLVENYRPGVADKIGIGYDEVSQDNPRLIYCSVSAFGPAGPMAEYPGTDPVVQAMSGVMSVTGDADGEPVLVGVPMADFTGAMVCFQGVLLGLAARERSGRGQKVDISMLHAMMFSLTTRLAGYLASGEDPARFGSAHSVVVPYQAFEASDGHFVAGVWVDTAWPVFCKAVGMPELADDPRYATNVDRVANRDELLALLAGHFRTRTTAEWEASFRAAGGLFGPVLTFSRLFEHPQIVASGAVGEVEHPTLGPLTQLMSPIALSDTPGRLGAAPPLLGQHTEDVLREAGYDDREVRALLDDAVALAAPDPVEPVR
jgi:crotonobetainyl-CoA:carnitine CoA-transferase CaiB-like acyl-CoA transferase